MLSEKNLDALRNQIQLQMSSQISVHHTIRTKSVPSQFKTSARVILTAIKPAIIDVALMAADDSAQRRLVCSRGSKFTPLGNQSPICWDVGSRQLLVHKHHS